MFIPKANIPDLEEVDSAVKENLEFVPVEFADEIIDKALVSFNTENSEWKMDERPVVTQGIRPTLR